MFLAIPYFVVIVPWQSVGVFIQRNGMMEWNGGMKRWNDHAHRARFDDLYPLCLRP